MSMSVSGAFKAWIESPSRPWTGLSAWRDKAGQGATPPYVVIQEGISIVPARLGDNGVGDSSIEQVQLDLWETWRNANHELVESYTLARQFERELNAAALTGLANTQIHGVVLLSRTRQPDEQAQLVRNIFTVEIRRDQ